MRAVLIASVVALVVALGVTPVLVGVLRALGMGQPIQDEVTQHADKAGSPTMGGLVVPLSVTVAYLAAQPIVPGFPQRNAVIVLGAILGGGLTGVVDDWLKVRRGRNLGLREGQKTMMLLAVAIAFAIGYASGPSACTRIAVTRCSTLPWDLGRVGWSIGAVALFWVSSNAVNFTDGIEGLLSGSATSTFTALAVIAFWEFRHAADYRIDGAVELAVIAAALAAACAGFLWWNGVPGHIFMGDSGSLAIGAGIVALVLSLQVTLLLPILGCLYVAEGASSSLQRYYFRITGGRRLFRMAPLHHHFEMLGWPEFTILVRLWIVSGIGAALAIALFYGDALRLL
jgi:phospho-N-acetylmuramoyl-pentapeptide-transferase